MRTNIVGFIKLKSLLAFKQHESRVLKDSKIVQPVAKLN